MAGSTLNAIEGTLRAIQSAIMRHPAFIGPPGTNPGDPDHRANQEKLDKLRRDLTIALRELKNRSEMLNLREQAAVREPLEQRWRTRQSIGDQRTVQAKVYGLAVNILAQLDSVQDANGRPSIPHIIQYLLEEGLEGKEMVTALIQQDRSHYDSLLQPTMTVQNIPLAFLLALLIARLGLAKRQPRVVA